MKLNKKGFTLVELLTVIVILITILLIAIPSITSSLSRSENKQIEAKKSSILADVKIKLKRSDIENYSNFKNGTCVLSIKNLLDLGYVTETTATDKKGNLIEGCVGYSSDELVFLPKNSCESWCLDEE